MLTNAITPKISFPMSINCNIKREEVSDVKDLDYFQMEKFLKWMKLFFDDYKEELDSENENDEKEENSETKKAYKRELYNIYIGIISDYKQYKTWKKYNNSLWILSSYRSKNTIDLSKKIMADIQLFNEGIKMFSLLNK
jgi:hypothetical protein